MRCPIISSGATSAQGREALISPRVMVRLARFSPVRWRWSSGIGSSLGFYDNGDDETGEGERTQGKENAGDAQPEDFTGNQAVKFLSHACQVALVQFILTRLNRPHT